MKNLSPWERFWVKALLVLMILSIPACFILDRYFHSLEDQRAKAEQVRILKN
jgi:hypothetical protein